MDDIVKTGRTSLPADEVIVTTIAKVLRFQNMVITVNTNDEGSEVVARNPKWMVPQVERFLAALPKT